MINLPVVTWQGINKIFVLSSQKHQGINLQADSTLFKKMPLPSHEVHPAGAQSVLMRKCMHFLVRPGAVGSLQLVEQI